MTGLSDGSQYSYDENGNMTCRIENDQTYIQSYNAENRIVEVEAVTGNCEEHGDTTATWAFTYDGDGVKVMQVYTGEETTLTTRYYMGGAYEVTSQDGQPDITRKYYSLSGITVAVSDGANLYYFLTDHLGSVVVVTDANGTLVAEQRYMPFGQVRTDVGTLVTQTDFGYTFQRDLPGMGLMDYKARLYDANIGRFIQADSIVPYPQAPMSFDRYSYSNNNPIYYTDPSGHLGIPFPWKTPETEDEETTIINQFIAEHPKRNNIVSNEDSNMTISDEGIDFITSWDTFSPNLYNDPGGDCTIGFGHLVHEGSCTANDPYQNGITLEEAQDLFAADIQWVEDAINASVTVPLTQNQFDALADFVFNFGGPAFSTSNLLTYLNQGNYDTIPEELRLWIKDEDPYNPGQYIDLPGLMTRREQEILIWLSSIYSVSH